jgi:predicted phage-related endonuclease
MKLSHAEHAERADILIGLSPEDVEERRHSLGASDANTVLSGDPERILKLWRFKVGLEPAEDLSDILAVQMGSWTEALNLRWFEKNTGHRVTRTKGTKVTHPELSWLKATLDGHMLFDDVKCPVEAKHVSPFNFDIEVIAQRYAPQLAVQMMCLDAPHGALSVFSGNSKWEHKIIARDQFYEDQVLRALKVFWTCVQAKLPPVEIAEVRSSVPVQLMRDVDYSTHNAWCSFEQEYLDYEAEAKLFENAEKELRTLVPSDAKTCTGRFLVARRSKNNAVRFFKKKG